MAVTADLERLTERQGADRLLAFHFGPKKNGTKKVVDQAQVVRGNDLVKVTILTAPACMKCGTACYY
ncbi:hypothetical protein [Actinomadura vinacea]|uniref:hypothetical protein n=1 Tax=Actinomadura vinacea TaxID=115336 RepID=UPI0031DD040D